MAVGPRNFADLLLLLIRTGPPNFGPFGPFLANVTFLWHFNVTPVTFVTGTQNLSQFFPFISAMAQDQIWAHPSTLTCQKAQSHVSLKRVPFWEPPFQNRSKYPDSSTHFRFKFPLFFYRPSFSLDSLLHNSITTRLFSLRHPFGEFNLFLCIFN